MDYYSENGDKYTVAQIGVGKDGVNYGVVIFSEDGTDKNLISIVPSTDKMSVEQQLAEYSKENSLIPSFVWRLKKGEITLKGKMSNVNDFIKVTDDVVADAFRHYIAAKNHIDALEAEKKNKIEEVKKDYAEQVEAEEATMESIESIVRSGTKKEECVASWERDIENGIMLLIRKDNYKVLQWRYMDEQELQLQTDDEGANPEQTEES